MSGGSLNYLCYKEAADLFGCIDEIEQVEAELLRRGYKDIAKDVRRLIEYINSAENRIAVLNDQLHGVFKAVEWYRSADWGEGSLKEALDEYRQGMKDNGKGEGE